MTLSDIEATAARFAAAGRRNIPVPISEWKEIQMARIAAATVKTNPKTGRQQVKPVDKANASQRIGRKAKADRLEKAWKSVTKDAKGNMVAKADDTFFLVGAMAHDEGIPITKCPLDGRTKQAKNWKAGHAAAAKEARKAARKA